MIWPAAWTAVFARGNETAAGPADTQDGAARPLCVTLRTHGDDAGVVRGIGACLAAKGLTVERLAIMGHISTFNRIQRCEAIHGAPYAFSKLSRGT